MFVLVSCLNIVGTSFVLTPFLWWLHAMTRLVFNGGVVGEGLSWRGLV